MSYKLSRRSFAALIGAGMALAAAPLAHAQGEFHVAYASPSAASDPTQEATIWFMDEVTKRTDGRVTFEPFLGNSLVKDQDIINAIGDNLVQMGKIYTVSYPGQLPVWNMVNLPFTSPSPYVAQNVIHDLMEEYPIFYEELAELNVRPLGVIATGGTGIVSKKPIQSVEDLKDFKVRARGIQAAAFEAAGATPVSIPWNDVYEALSKGVVEGSTNYIVTTRPIRHNEVADYYIPAGLGQAIQLELINQDFWESLPEDIQQVMTEVMAEAEQRYAERASQLAIEERKALAEETGPAKMEYLEFPAEERQKWKEMSPDFFAEWAEQNAAAADTNAIVASYMKFQDEYMQKGKELGLVDMW